MTLKIKAEVVLDKVNKFMSNLKELKQLSYSVGRDKMYDIDGSVKSLITVAFENAKERQKSYNGFWIMTTAEKTPQEEQEDYIGDLDSRIRTLKSWKEEMELIIETSTESSKIDKIETEVKSSKIEKLKSQIKEKGLEAERRGKVVEAKFNGAVIELLDMQRNMLKDKTENTKSLIALQKDIGDIKEMLSRLSREVIGE